MVTEFILPIALFMNKEVQRRVGHLIKSKATRERTFMLAGQLLRVNTLRCLLQEQYIIYPPQLFACGERREGPALHPEPVSHIHQEP